MIIRPFKKTEFAHWKQLFEGYMSDEPGWNRRLTRANWDHVQDKKHPYKALAAYEGKNPVGFIAVSDRFSATALKPVCYISDAYVMPAHRRKGIGRALFEAVFKTCDNAHYGRIEWKAMSANKVAQKFYNTIGVRTGWIIYERHKRK